MKQVSSTFKSEVKKFGRQIDSIITYNDGTQDIVLKKPKLNGVSLSYEGGILKSVMKELKFECDTYITPNTEVNYSFGVMVDIPNETYEYIDYGTFVVNKIEKKEDTNSYEITAYDKLLNSMKDYQQFVNAYPITIRDYITQLATYIQLDFANKNDTFANYDKQIQKELYLTETGSSLGYTFRDVLNELAQVTASTICINNDNKLELRYIGNTVDTIGKASLKDINVNFGKKYGPINSIVLSRAGGSDNIYLQDTQSITQNGLCEYKITENQIMNFNDRDTYLQGILTELDGLEYYLNDFSSTGITYLELCDRYEVEIDDNTYSCVLLNDEINITQGLEEMIFTDRPEESKTDYSKADKTDRRINQAYQIVDKQNQTIESLVSRTDTLSDELGNVYTKQQINQLLQDLESGWTYNFISNGGTNILRNTGLWFKNEDGALYPYEFWTGNVARVSEEKAQNGNALLLKNGTVYQEQRVPNGRYTLSFKYKLINNLGEASVKINGVEYELPNTYDTEFYTGQKDANGNYITQPIDISSRNIKIEFLCDTDEACEIYDLMLNVGDERAAYEQNQNETTTDTVNISKGITITSTDTNTVFKANSDGIRVYADNDMTNPRTYFTDKGMTTKEMIVEDKGEISGVLIQEIGNQTWFTKI